MTESERIKNIEKHITLAGLLPGVNLGSLSPEESAKLKHAVLDLYRLSHARGFMSGADHAIASAIQPQPNDSEMQCLKRWLSARMGEYWQEFKKSLRSIRATVIRSPQRRRFPTEALNGKWATRR
jgi:hypothetical protein